MLIDSFLGWRHLFISSKPEEIIDPTWENGLKILPMRLLRGLLTSSVGFPNQFPGNLCCFSSTSLQGDCRKKGCGRFRGCIKGEKDDFILRKESNGFVNDDPDESIDKDNPGDLWWC